MSFASSSSSSSSSSRAGVKSDAGAQDRFHESRQAMQFSLRKEKRVEHMNKMRTRGGIFRPKNENDDKDEERDDEAEVDAASEDVRHLAQEIHAYINAGTHKAPLQALSNRPQSNCAALTHLREFVSSRGSSRHMAAVIECKIVTALVAILREKEANQADIFLALCCLANIASGDSVYAKEVLAAVPFLIAFLACPVPDLQEQAAWTVGNLAGDGYEFRDALAAAGAVGPLLKLLDSNAHSHSALVRVSAWCLGNFLKGPPHELGRSLLLQQRGGLLHRAVGLLKGEPTVTGNLTSIQPVDNAIVVEVGWILCFFTAQYPEAVRMIVEENDIQTVPTLIALLQNRCDLRMRYLEELSASRKGPGREGMEGELKSSEEAIANQLRGVRAALDGCIASSIVFLRVLGNLVVASDPSACAAVLSYPASLHLVAHLLVDSSREIRKECAWIVSSMLAGPKDFVRAIGAEKTEYIQSVGVYGADMIGPLCEAFRVATYEVQRELAYGMFFLARDERYTHKVLAPHRQVVATMLALLQAQSDGGVLHTALRFLEVSFRTGGPQVVQLVEELGGLDTLERLQTHCNPTLYRYASALIDEFMDSISGEEIAERKTDMQFSVRQQAGENFTF